ncbi:MAG: luciferase family protein [Actinomycetota bacterium]
MPSSISAGQQITDEVGSWPGVEASPGPRGEFGFRIGGRELGHLLGDHAAHFSFPKEVGLRLRNEGRVVDHPVFPGKPGFVARRIDGDNDVRDVIEMMRLNYDRIVAATDPSAQLRRFAEEVAPEVRSAVACDRVDGDL